MTITETTSNRPFCRQDAPAGRPRGNVRRYGGIAPPATGADVTEPVVSAPGDADRMAPRTFAYTLGEHVADVEGDDRADAYLADVVDELFELNPGLRERFVDEVLDGLIEFTGDPKLVRPVEDYRDRGGER